MKSKENHIFKNLRRRITEKSDVEDSENSEIPKNKISKTQLRLMKFNNRVTKWASESLNENLVTALNKGLYNNKTVFDHEFRDLEKLKHMSKKPFVPQKSYITEKEKIEKAEKNFRDIFLEKERFNERKIRLDKSQRLKHKELGNNLRFSHRTENERIKEILNFNKMRDISVFDSDMIHFSNWRKDQDLKYKGRLRRNQSMKPYFNNYNVFKNKGTSWKDFDFFLKNELGEEIKNDYIDGLYQLGNDITKKKRVKDQEVIF